MPCTFTVTCNTAEGESVSKTTDYSQAAADVNEVMKIPFGSAFENVETCTLSAVPPNKGFSLWVFSRLLFLRLRLGVTLQSQTTAGVALLIDDVLLCFKYAK